jgi:hypothetical protein
MEKQLTTLGMIILSLIFSMFVFMYEAEGAEDEFDKLYRFNDGAIVTDGLWGFKDSCGNVVIEPKYLYVDMFSEGLVFVVDTEGQAGFIDMTGNFVISFPHIPFSTFLPRQFSNGLAPVILREWDLDTEERINIHIGTDFSPRYHPGPIVFIDKTGEIAFDREFLTADVFSEGLAFVRCVTGTNEQTGYIDLTGNLVISLPTDKTIFPGRFHYGVAAVIVREWDLDNEEPFNTYTRGPFIFIDRTGQDAFGEEFLSVFMCEDRITPVFRLNGNGIFIDRTTGENVFGMEFGSVSTFNQHGFAPVLLLDGRLRYIDRSGNLFYAGRSGLFYDETYFPEPTPVTREDVKIQLSIGNTAAFVDGVPIELDVAPFIGEDDKAMIPLRFLADTMGATIDWNAETKTAAFTHPIVGVEGSLNFVIGLPIRGGGQGTPEIRNGRVFIPVCVMTYDIDSVTDWDSVTQTVTVVI